MPADQTPMLNVVIADDSSTIRLFIINALRRSDYQFKITEASDGSACLNMLASGKFDMAFVDINMPRMSGIEAVNHSREMGVSTFITIMSSHNEPEKLQIARKLGAYAYLVKPFTPEQVILVVRNYIELVRRRSVLLVDDSRAIRAVILRVLENSFFNLGIQEASDGNDALLRYQDRHHDIVFLDLNMPGISGSETLAKLREMNRDVQVVLITTEQNRRQVEALDPDSYVSVLYKPFYTEDVDRVLHELYGLELPALRHGKKRETPPPPEPAPTEAAPEPGEDPDDVEYL